MSPVRFWSSCLRPAYCNYPWNLSKTWYNTALCYSASACCLSLFSLWSRSVGTHRRAVAPTLNMTWHQNAIFEFVQVPWCSLAWGTHGKHERFNIVHLSMLTIIYICINSAINSTISCHKDSRMQALYNSRDEEWNEKKAASKAHPAPLLLAAAVLELLHSPALPMQVTCWEPESKSLLEFCSLIFMLPLPSIHMSFTEAYYPNWR